MARRRRPGRPDRQSTPPSSADPSTGRASDHEDRAAGDDEAGEEEEPGQEKRPCVLTFDPMGMLGIHANPVDLTAMMSLWSPKIDSAWVAMVRAAT